MWFFRNKRLHKQWGSHNWIQAILSNSQTAYPDNLKKGAQEIASFAKSSLKFPVLVSFNKIAIGENSHSGQDSLWACAVTISWPDHIDATPLVFKIKSTQSHNASLSINEKCGIDKILVDIKRANKHWLINV